MNLCKTCGTICPFDDEHEECDNYKPMTNEDWLRTATTEQFADVLSDYYLMGVSHGINGIDITPRTNFVEWLKQPHTVKE